MYILKEKGRQNQLVYQGKFLYIRIFLLNKFLTGRIPNHILTIYLRETVFIDVERVLSHHGYINPAGARLEFSVVSRSLRNKF